MFTATYAPILIGTALAFLLHWRGAFTGLYRLLGTRLSAPLAFAALLVLLIFLPRDVTGWPNLALHLTMAACLAAIVIREDHPLRPVLTLRPVVRVGQISYGIYLYHLIGLHLTTTLLGALGWDNGWLVLIGYTLVSVAISDLSFRYYETPFLALRHRPRKRAPATD